MKRKLAGLLLFLALLVLSGCGGMGEKGVNKGKDKPVPASK